MISKVQRSYKFRFYPNKAQERQLAIEFGHARFVFNWALETRTTAYKENGESLNYVGLGHRLTELKKTDCPWLAESTASCLTQKLIDQDKAFKNFFEGRASYPKFKKKTDTQSVRYQLDQRHVHKNFDADAGFLKLPKLGQLKLKWSRHVNGTPKMVTVSRDPAGRYFVSMACEMEITALPAKTNAVGVDVGIKDVVVTSDGFKSGAPRNTHKHARRLKLEQRRLARKRKGSNRRRKQAKKVARIHAKIADSRRDFLNKTSSRLVNENQVICLEDLNIKGMLRNRCLSKAVADSGLSELRRQIEYKAQWNDRDVIIVDRFAPTSKTCSACGSYQPEMPLKIRKWTCPDCGADHDRDINAANNILIFGTVGSTGTARKGKARGAANPPKAVA